MWMAGPCAVGLVVNMLAPVVVYGAGAAAVPAVPLVMPPTGWTLTMTLAAANEAVGVQVPLSVVVALAALVEIENPAASLEPIVNEPPKSLTTVTLPAATSPPDVMETV